MQAMILAAGFGTRLLPFTKLRPKPLFPVLNEPLLLLTIRHLQAAGCDHIIVNCHYLKEQIVEALSGISGVFIQEEEIVLGTGGGLRKALESLRDEPLLVSNGDIYHTVDLSKLYSVHIESRSLVTMAMHDFPRFNNVKVENDQVTGFSAPENENALAFTGLHVLNPEVLERIPAGQNYSIIDCYRELLQEGQKISVQRVDGCAWTDMGTVDDYLALHGKLLKGEIPLWPEFENIHGNNVLIDVETGRAGEILLDWACVGHVQLPKNVCLQRCVVWDGARVEEGGAYSGVLLV